jgi:hypothetical protein
MVRTQILLEPHQYAYLKHRSEETGQSLSRLVRQAVDRLSRDEDPVRERALRLLGAFASDTGDISERHDEYFAEAIREA